MTTPVGSGKNACYGYEEDLDSDPESADAPKDVFTAEGSTLYCAVPPVDYTMAGPTQGPTPCDLSPDYVTLSASMSVVITATVAMTEDRYGNTYAAGGGGLSTPGLSGSLTRGYLRDPADLCDPPNADELQHFLTGGAWTVTAGAGVGAGTTVSSGRVAAEIGQMTPQVGVSYTIGSRL